MKTYKINVVQHCTFTVEAKSEDQAREIATEDVIWDDYLKHVDIYAEEQTDEES